ncbi:MAG: LacI family DNA-binding transcriptional regulator [Lentisphaeria bacterium]|nr:LacI family DNA-binding transcriptional regulator [Lentisphaeria bacterium]
MSATIYDVAEKAGVYFQLASAVQGRKKYAHASAATRKRIFDAALQLNYRSNTAAVVLAGGSSR